MDPINASFIILNPDGSVGSLDIKQFHRCQLVDFMTMAQSKVPTKVGNVFRIGSTTCNLSILGANAYIGLSPSGFHFNTHFAVDKASLVPVLQPGAGHQMLRLYWEKPENMALRFGIWCDWQGKAWTFQAAYLLASCSTRKGWLRLPLPNIHEDARICMGSSFKLQETTLDQMVTKVWDHFNASPWQTDLSPGLGEMQSVFRFDINTQKAVHSGDWTGHAKVTNLAMFEHFV